jgi:damage-control phosphatase, subfamily I
LELQRECADCIYGWVYKRTEPHVREELKPLLSEKIARALEIQGSRNAGLLCNRAVFSAQKVESNSLFYYQSFKEEVNRQAETLLPSVEAYVRAGATRREKFERALFTAAAGNVSPLGPPSSVFTFPEIREIMAKTSSPVLAGDAFDAVLGSRRILYITDNAGEIGFDSLLIKLLKEIGARVTLTVKDGPFFEDAGMSDAVHFGLDRIADGIVATKGFFVKGESDPLLDSAFHTSDLIMAKGTGSYEALQGETGGKRTIFMLKVKCGPISRDTGVEQGRVLVKVET